MRDTPIVPRHLGKNRMNEHQFRALLDWFARVLALGDALGSESTDSGVVLITAAESVGEAVRTLLPRDWSTHPLAWRRFEAEFLGPLLAGPQTPPHLAQAARTFLTSCDPLEPEGLLVGPPEFDPGAPDRGGFHVGLFLHARPQTGWNLLILFPRVET